MKFNYEILTSTYQSANSSHIKSDIVFNPSANKYVSRFFVTLLQTSWHRLQINLSGKDIDNNSVWVKDLVTANLFFCSSSDKEFNDKEIYFPAFHNLFTKFLDYSKKNINFK